MEERGKKGMDVDKCLVEEILGESKHLKCRVYVLSAFELLAVSTVLHADKHAISSCSVELSSCPGSPSSL